MENKHFVLLMAATLACGIGIGLIVNLTLKRLYPRSAAERSNLFLFAQTFISVLLTITAAGFLYAWLTP